nr:Chain E, LYS-GLU-ILE-VAL-ASN-PRO-LEU-THR-LYS [Plasmodium falciparum 3D7]
KEIVNPLTK